MNFVKINMFGYRETMHNFFWRVLQLLGKQGVTILIFFLMANLLSQELFGVYNYLMAFVILVILFADFGISSATSKYIAERYPEDPHEEISNSLIMVLAFSLLTFIIGLLLGFLFLREYFMYLVYLSPLIFLIPLSSLYDGIYRGMKKFKQLTKISILSGLFSIIITIFLILNMGFAGALIAQVFSYLLLVVILTLRQGPIKIKIYKNNFKKIFTYALILGVGGIGLILYNKIDVLFLGRYGFINEISNYEIINKILMIAVLPFNILAQVIAPTISKNFKDKKYATILKKLRISLAISSVGGVLAFLFIYFAPSYLLFLVPVEYSSVEMITLFKWMAIIFFTQVLNGIIPLGFVISTGHGSLITKFLICFGIFHVILNYFFIEAFGFIGIIYSIVITRIITDILFIAVYYRKIKNYSALTK
jgi:O-antigen/teichoic acid export membrane protein